MTITVYELRPAPKRKHIRTLIIDKEAARAVSGLRYLNAVQTLERLTGVILTLRKRKFVCPICIQCGLTKKEATRHISEGYIPRRRTKVENLICAHCHDSSL